MIITLLQLSVPPGYQPGIQTHQISNKSDAVHLGVGCGVGVVVRRKLLSVLLSLLSAARRSRLRTVVGAVTAVGRLGARLRNNGRCRLRHPHHQKNQIHYR